MAINNKKVLEAVLAGEIKNPYMEVVPAFYIREAPAASAVEVVRCKDCRYRGDEYECPLLAFAEYTCDDEYCSDGERREDNEID